MAIVPNGEERLRKILIAWVGRTNVTDERWHLANVNVSSRSLIKRTASCHLPLQSAPPMELIWQNECRLPLCQPNARKRYWCIKNLMRSLELAICLNGLRTSAKLLGTLDSAGWVTNEMKYCFQERGFGISPATLDIWRVLRIINVLLLHALCLIKFTLYVLVRTRSIVDRF